MAAPALALESCDAINGVRRRGVGSRRAGSIMESKLTERSRILALLSVDASAWARHVDCHGGPRLKHTHGPLVPAEPTQGWPGCGNLHGNPIRPQHPLKSCSIKFSVISFPPQCAGQHSKPTGTPPRFRRQRHTTQYCQERIFSQQLGRHCTALHNNQRPEMQQFRIQRPVLRPPQKPQDRPRSSAAPSGRIEPDLRTPACPSP